MLLLDEGLRILQTPFEPREQARDNERAPFRALLPRREAEHLTAGDRCGTPSLGRLG